MLPAAHGDSLWIEYGPARRPLRILIDGGPAHTYDSGLRQRLGPLTKEKSIVFELVVITHIDADHIDGMLIMLRDNKVVGDGKVEIKELWFNAWEQIAKFEGPETFGPLQGEFLGGILNLNPKLRRVWNKSFNKGKGPVGVPATGLLTPIPLEGGAEITLLGPTASELQRLRARWVSAIRDFTPGDTDEAIRRLEERRDYRPPVAANFGARQFGADRTPANGSSISFLLEDGRNSILLVGDAHARTLESTLGRLALERKVEKLSVGAVKLPHHGSMGNVTAKWLQMIDCDRWLISTNGAIFGHPDIETVELIADNSRKKPTIFCNYRSSTTSKLEGSTRWNVVFPEDRFLGPAGGLLLKLGRR